MSQKTENEKPPGWVSKQLCIHIILPKHTQLNGIQKEANTQNIENKLLL